MVNMLKQVIDYFPRQALISKVDEALPGLLGETATHIHSGLTFEQALGNAVESGESVLHIRLRKALAGVTAKKSLFVQLSALSEELGSEQFSRIIGLLLPAIRGGTASAALLEEIRADLEERSALRREFVVSTRSFVAFIRLSVLALMPALLAISIIFLDRLAAIKTESGLGSTDFGMMSLAAGSLPDVGTITLLAYVMVGGTVLFATMLTSVIATGSWLKDLKKAPLYIALSMVVFVVARLLLANIV